MSKRARERASERAREGVSEWVRERASERGSESVSEGMNELINFYSLSSSVWTLMGLLAGPFPTLVAAKTLMS